MDDPTNDVESCSVKPDTLEDDTLFLDICTKENNPTNKSKPSIASLSENPGQTSNMEMVVRSEHKELAGSSKESKEDATENSICHFSTETDKDNDFQNETSREETPSTDTSSKKTEVDDSNDMNLGTHVITAPDAPMDNEKRESKCTMHSNPGNDDDILKRSNGDSKFVSIPQNETEQDGEKLLENKTEDEQNKTVENNDKEADIASALHEVNADMTLDMCTEENFPTNTNKTSTASLSENQNIDLNEDTKRAKDEEDNFQDKTNKEEAPLTNSSSKKNEVAVSNDMNIDTHGITVPDSPKDRENRESNCTMQSNIVSDIESLKWSHGDSQFVSIPNLETVEDSESLSEVKTQVEQNKNLSEKKVENGPTKTLRIVLIGQTGVGKSSTGNTILGEKRFKSSPSSKSCTEVCQRETAMKQGFILEVLDTPGLFDTHKPAEDLRKEFLNCMIMTNPGPHAFLMILKMNRITEQEKRTLKSLKEIFGGDHFLRHTIIVITRKEDLAETISKDAGTTDESLDLLFKATLEKSPDLYHMVVQCKNRYFLLSNKGKVDGINRTQQANQLVSLIDEMTRDNGDNFYSYQYFINLEEERKLKLKREAEQKEKERRLQKEMKQKEELAKLRETELELKLEKAQIKREKEQRRARREKERLQAELRKEQLEKERLRKERERQKQERQLREVEEEIRRKERERERQERQLRELENERRKERKREKQERRLREFSEEIRKEREREKEERRLRELEECKSIEQSSNSDNWRCNMM